METGILLEPMVTDIALSDASVQRDVAMRPDLVRK